MINGLQPNSDGLQPTSCENEHTLLRSFASPSPAVPDGFRLWRRQLPNFTALPGGRTDPQEW